MKWVSVGDELPREARTAVMVSNGHTVAPAWWVDGGFAAFCDWNLPLRWVTHWSHFPNPPREKEYREGGGRPGRG